MKFMDNTDYHWRIIENRYSKSWYLYKKDRHDVAVHFHTIIWREIPKWYEREYKEIKGQIMTAAGIELHCTINRHGTNFPPIDRCENVDGPCYAYGTSLVASRFFEYWDGEDETVFRELKSWLDNLIEEVDPIKNGWYSYFGEIIDENKND